MFAQKHSKKEELQRQSVPSVQDINICEYNFLLFVFQELIDTFEIKDSIIQPPESQNE